MSTDLSLEEMQKRWHGTFKAYLIGFILCTLLTAASFSLVMAKILSGRLLIYTIISFGIVQAVVQLLCFLHIGQEAKPRWETLVFCCTLLVLLIVIIGSLWIMHDLNDRMMEM